MTACVLPEEATKWAFFAVVALGALVLWGAAIGFCYTAIREWLDDRIHRKEYLRKGGN